jgi:LysR family glycine cleavage system transcriptional activator
VYEDEAQRRPWLSWPAWLEMAGVADLRPAGSIAFNQYEPTLRAARRWTGRGAGHAGAGGRPAQAGQAGGALPQRFANPRAYYLVLAERAATNPAIEPFRLWLASRVKSAAGRTKLSPSHATRSLRPPPVQETA